MYYKTKVPEGFRISIFRLVLESGNLYYLHNYFPSTKNSPGNNRSIINENSLTRQYYTVTIH